MERIAKWLLLGAGLLYWTGFLIRTCYLDLFFGISASTADAFKADYILIGALFWLFPLLVCIPGCCLFYLRRRASKDVASAWSYEKRQAAESAKALRLGFMPNMIMVLQLPVVLYFFLLFAPPSFFARRFIPLGVVLVCTLVVVRVPRNATLFGNRLFVVICQWGITTLVIIADIFICIGLGRTIAHIVTSYGAIAYALFVGLTIYLAYRVGHNARRYQEKREKMLVWLLGACWASSFYILALFSFSYGIYTHIPTSRGGGDLDSSPVVFLTFRDMEFDVPQSLSAAKCGHTVGPLKVIDQTSALLSVTVNTTPDTWKHLGQRVSVYQWPRSELLSVAIVSDQGNQRFATRCGKEMAP